MSPYAAELAFPTFQNTFDLAAEKMEIDNQGNTLYRLRKIKGKGQDDASGKEDNEEGGNATRMKTPIADSESCGEGNNSNVIKGKKKKNESP
jgi:hypothetical protein